MSKAKHTSGPWFIDNSTDYVNGLDLDAISVVQKNGDQWCVAAVWTDIPDFKEATANARLISKAPEMLEMLQSVVDLQANHYGSGIDTHLALIRKAAEIRELIKSIEG